MDNTDFHSLDELTLQLRQQYREFSALLDALTQNSERVEIPFDQISQQIKQIKHTESLLIPLRQQFSQSGLELSQRLIDATNETIVIVKSVLPKLEQLEKLTSDSVQRLFPQVRQSVRAVQMQNAYQNSR